MPFVLRSRRRFKTTCGSAPSVESEAPGIGLTNFVSSAAYWLKLSMSLPARSCSVADATYFTIGSASVPSFASPKRTSTRVSSMPLTVTSKVVGTTCGCELTHVDRGGLNHATELDLNRVQLTVAVCVARPDVHRSGSSRVERERKVNKTAKVHHCAV